MASFRSRQSCFDVIIHGRPYGFVCALSNRQLVEDDRLIEAVKCRPSVPGWSGHMKSRRPNARIVVGCAFNRWAWAVSLRNGSFLDVV